MVDFSINGIKISILLTKFSLLIPLNLGGISIMRIVLPLKNPRLDQKYGRLQEQLDEFRFSKSKFYWEKSSNLDANPFSNTAFANGNPNQPQPKILIFSF
jgi:hypothetical protein